MPTAIILYWQDIFGFTDTVTARKQYVIFKLVLWGWYEQVDTEKRCTKPERITEDGRSNAAQADTGQKLWSIDLELNISTTSAIIPLCMKF